MCKCIKKAIITFALATILLILFLEEYYNKHKFFQILQQNSLQLKFEITIRLNNFVQHPFPLSPPNITAQSLPPPFITTEVIYKYDRYTKNTIGYITFYNPYSGLSYTSKF